MLENALPLARTGGRGVLEKWLADHGHLKMWKFAPAGGPPLPSSLGDNEDLQFYFSKEAWRPRDAGESRWQPGDKERCRKALQCIARGEVATFRMPDVREWVDRHDDGETPPEGLDLSEVLERPQLATLLWPGHAHRPMGAHP
jgi:hypothetical protein